jgi:hypothetical protein
VLAKRALDLFLTAARVPTSQTFLARFSRTARRTSQQNRHCFKLRECDGGGPGAAGTELLKPAAENLLQRWPVSKRVNSSRAPDDDPTLIEEISTAN